MQSPTGEWPAMPLSIEDDAFLVGLPVDPSSLVDDSSTRGGPPLVGVTYPTPEAHIDMVADGVVHRRLEARDDPLTAYPGCTVTWSADVPDPAFFDGSVAYEWRIVGRAGGDEFSIWSALREWDWAVPSELEFAYVLLDVRD